VNACAVPPSNCQAGDDLSASNNACNRVLCNAESVSFCASRGDAQCFEHDDMCEYGNFQAVGIHKVETGHSQGGNGQTTTRA